MSVIVRALESAGYVLTWIVWNLGGKYIYRLILRPIFHGAASAIIQTAEHDRVEAVAHSMDVIEVRRVLATALYNHMRLRGVRV